MRIKGLRTLAAPGLRFYFAQNLKSDAYLRQKVEDDPSAQGWIALAEFCNFPKIKAMRLRVPDLAAAVRKRAQQLEVSADGESVRRRPGL